MKKEIIIYLAVAAAILTGYFIFKDSKLKDPDFFTSDKSANDINETILAELCKPVENGAGLVKIVDQQRRKSDYDKLQVLQVKIKRYFDKVKEFKLQPKEYYQKIITDIQYILDNKKPV